MVRDFISQSIKDEVVDYALGVIAKNTPLLELEADGGNNAEYYKLTTAVARSGAPNAEDIFVKHASSAKNADPEEALRQHFSRCRDEPTIKRPRDHRWHLAAFGATKRRQFRSVEMLRSDRARAATGYLVRRRFAGLVSRTSRIAAGFTASILSGAKSRFVGSPGGVGKTSLAIGMAVAIATGKELLGEKIYRW